MRQPLQHILRWTAAFLAGLLMTVSVLACAPSPDQSNSSPSGPELQENWSFGTGEGKLTGYEISTDSSQPLVYIVSLSATDGLLGELRSWQGEVGSYGLTAVIVSGLTARDEPAGVADIGRALSSLLENDSRQPEETGLVCVGSGGSGCWSLIADSKLKVPAAVMIAVPLQEEVSFESQAFMSLLTLYIKSDEPSIATYDNAHHDLMAHGIHHDMITYDKVGAEFLDGVAVDQDRVTWLDMRRRSLHWLKRYIAEAQG